MMNGSGLSSITLAGLPRHVRIVLRWFIVTLTLGYTTGLLFVVQTTSLTPKGVEERYRGNENEVASDTLATTAPMEVSPAGDTVSAPIDLNAPAEMTPSADAPELKFQKSLPEMLNITHTHILAMASFLLPVALIFAFSSRVRGGWKTFLLVEPFAALLVSFAAMWLMWGVHPAFTYLLMLSSTSFGICLYAMLGISFLELGRSRT